MSLIRLNSGRTFEAASGVTLIDAAASAGITLPYSCRTGRCSTCKALVQQGETRPLTDEVGLSFEQRQTGWILTCARTAETDVVLDIEDLVDVQLPQPKTLPCRIAKMEPLAPDVLQVTLRLPPTAQFSFIPGQYIEVIGINGVRRSYSLANANASAQCLELHIRAVPGGILSDYWFNQAQLNDLLRLNGPLGTFFLRDCAQIDVYFLATGTGIAPIQAMLTHLAEVPKDQQPRSVTVLWGARKPEDFYRDLTKIPGKFRYIPVLSRPHVSWTGASGYVQHALLTLAPDLNQAAVYACGSDTMIHDAKKLLTDAGLPATRFYADAFVQSGQV